MLVTLAAGSDFDQVGVVTGSLLAASRYLVAAVFCQCRVLCFTAGLPAGYPFCSVCGVVSFVSGIRVLGLGPFPFEFSLSFFK